MLFLLCIHSSKKNQLCYRELPSYKQFKKEAVQGRSDKKEFLNEKKKMIKFIPSLKFHILLSTAKFNPFPKIRESCKINVVYKEGGDNGFSVNTMSKAAFAEG